jgi:uncharacterized protein (DUF1778 family)
MTDGDRTCIGANGADLSVQYPYSWSIEQEEQQVTTRARVARIEVRATADDRALIERAVEIEGTDLTSFVVGHATDAARRVLADRERFVLDAASVAEWDRITSGAARDLPGLRRLLDRPSPFTS